MPELRSADQRSCGRRRSAPALGEPTSSSSCAPCARRSARRARASARIRAAPAPRAARCSSASRASASSRSCSWRAASSAALRAASATASSARRLARSASRTARASRIALRLASRSTTAGSVGIVLGVGEEFFSQRLARLGGGRLAIGKAVTIDKRHPVPDARVYRGCGLMPQREQNGNVFPRIAAMQSRPVRPWRRGARPGRRKQDQSRRGIARTPGTWSNRLDARKEADNQGVDEWR